MDLDALIPEVRVYLDPHVDLIVSYSQTRIAVQAWNCSRRTWAASPSPLPQL
jgi:hypothetical protein